MNMTVLRETHFADLTWLILDEGPALKRVLVILTASALTVTRAQDATLETFAVLLETARFLTRAAFHMVLLMVWFLL